MTVHSRRALRVTATLAGVAALGATFSGTAFAAEQDETTQDNSVRNDTDEFDDAALDRVSDDDSRPADLGVGPVENLDLFEFKLPTAGPALAPTKKDDDEDNVSNPSSSRPHHYHPGAQEQPYDFDLYNPFETYGPNGCQDKGADRGPVWATAGGFGGYNGDSAGDCKVDSGDYHPNKTGFQGKDKSNGYNGYLGSDPAKQSENHYLFSLPGS